MQKPFPLITAALLVGLACSIAAAEPLNRPPPTVSVERRPPAFPPEIASAQIFTTAELTLENLERLALENNPTLAQASARVEAARGQWLQVGLYPNPRLSYLGGEMGNNGRAGQQGASVQQEIVTAQKLQWRRSVAWAEVQRAEQLWAAQEQRVVNDVRIQYYEVLAAQRSVELAHELVGIGKANVDLAEARFKAGEVGRADVFQARLETGSAKLLLSDAQNRRLAQWRRLTAVLGVPPAPPAPLTGDLDDSLPNVSWSDVLARLESQSPELTAALAEVDRARSGWRQAWADRVPNYEVQAGVQYDDASNYTVANVQFSVPLALYNRNQGEIRRAWAELALAERELDRVVLQLRHRLAALFERFDNARQRVAVYDAEITPGAKASLELVTQGYEAGEYDYVHLLAAQRTYVQANLDRLEALRELRASFVLIDGLLLSGALENHR